MRNERGTGMNTIPEQSMTSPGDSPSTSVWLRRSLIARTVLFWIIIGAIILFGLGAIIDPRHFTVDRDGHRVRSFPPGQDLSTVHAALPGDSGDVSARARRSH